MNCQTKTQTGVRKHLPAFVTMLLLLPVVAFAQAATDPGETLLTKITTMLVGTWGALLYTIIVSVAAIGAWAGAWKWSKVGGAIVMVVVIFSASLIVSWGSAQV